VNPLYPVLEATLEAAGWEELDRRPDRGLIVFPVTGDNGEWTAAAQAREADRQAFVYSIAREHVPEDRRTEAALLVARLNWGLALGTFELDLDDGQIRLRTSIDVGESDLTEALVKPLLLSNLTLMDHYLPAIDAVARGATAEEVTSRSMRVDPHPRA
jgi:hypothetical protein